MAITGLKIKELIFTALLLSLISVIVGTIYYQVLFLISPTYFTEFKFNQFKIPENLNPISGVAYLGFLSAFWTGPAIGTAIFLCFIPIRKIDLKPEIVKSLAIVISVALVSVLSGYIFAKWISHSPISIGGFNSNHISDITGLVIITMMNDFCLFGIMLGLPISIIRIITLARKQWLSTPSDLT